MSPHYWIEFRGAKKIALFVLMVVLIAVFWSTLPAKIHQMLFRLSPRSYFVNLPILMFIGWVGGWFLLLFVRGEDLHKFTPFDFQGLSRVIGVGMICGALVLAGLFLLWSTA